MHGRVLLEIIGNKHGVLFLRVGAALPEITENPVFLCLRHKKHGVALPEIIEKPLVFFWCGGGRRAGWRRGEEGSAELTVFATCQHNVFCAATRPAEWQIVWKPVQSTITKNE